MVYSDTDSDAVNSEHALPALFDINSVGNSINDGDGNEIKSFW